MWKIQSLSMGQGLHVLQVKMVDPFRIILSQKKGKKKSNLNLTIYDERREDEKVVTFCIPLKKRGNTISTEDCFLECHGGHLNFIISNLFFVFNLESLSRAYKSPTNIRYG